MKKIIFTILITLILGPTNTIAKKIDCTQFDKISTKYFECSAKNLKEKTEELKFKATVRAEEIKKKITTNTKDRKNKFDKSSLKAKFVKFKNSKTLTKIMEK